MKNQRAKLVLSAIALVLIVGIGLVIQWYRSGASPEPPSSFFNAREVQRAIARLESHRIDQQQRLNICRAITNHIERATEIPFTNPPVALESINGLQADLASLADQEEGPWGSAFDAFIKTASTAYNEAAELNKMLEQLDWSTLSVPMLERRIVRAKELVASVQTYPPWQSNETLRKDIYPAFEQAYRHRSEQNSEILKSRILAPGPALTRWYYARLLEDRSGLPQPICANTLEEERLSLELTHRDLVQTDAQGVFRNWTFLVTRARHLDGLSGIVRPLELSASLADWLAAADLQSAALDHLTQQTRAGSATPDPRVRVLLAELETLIREADQITQTFDTIPSLDSLALLVKGLQDLPKKYPDFASCTLAPLQATIEKAGSTVHSAQQLADTGDPNCEQFTETKIRIAELAAAAGYNVTSALLANTMDQWCNTHWPPVSELGKVAEGIRCLSNEAALPTLVASGVADLLDDIAASVNIEQRAELTRRWEEQVRPHLKAFPSLVRHLDRSLVSLEQLLLEDEFRRLVVHGEEAEIRSAAQEVLARPADARWESLQTSAREILMAIELSENRDRLDFEALDQLQQANPEWIPPPPTEPSAPRVNFDAYVRPILDYGNAIHRLEADIGDCADNIQTAYTSRSRYRSGESWTVLDDRFIHEVVSSPPPCLPLDIESLERVGNIASEMLHPNRGFDQDKRKRLMDYQLAATELRSLLTSTTKSSTHYRNTLFSVQEQIATLGGADENLADYLAARERQFDLLVALRQATNSFQRLRLIADDRLRQPLDTELEELARSLRSGLSRLRDVVELDRNAVEYRSRAEQMTEIAADYDRIAEDKTVPEALAAYARAQAACLLTYSLPADYSFRPHPKLGKNFDIAYGRLGEDIESIGYGRRFKGRGDDLQVWIRTGGSAVPILRGDWKDDPKSGLVRVSDLEALPGTNSWKWGAAVEVGIRVAHTMNSDKDLVPDETSERSRWNPLNYGVYRVQTNEYSVATFLSLEQLIRDHLASTNNAPHILLDRLFNPEAAEAATLAFTVDGIPEGRDFDWPKTIVPQTADDLRRLRTEIESSVSNLVEDLLLTP